MFFFYILLSITAFFSFNEIHHSLSGVAKRIIYVSIFLLVYLLSFLRWEYGTDWQSYYEIYLAYTLDNELNHEPLFVYVFIYARSIIDDFTFVLFVLSSILFYFQSRGIWKMSSLPLTSLFIFIGTYLVSEIGYTRQQIAMAFTLYSIVFIIKNNFWGYLLFSLFAFGFHYSSLVFLPAWWVFKSELSVKRWMFLIVLSMFLSSVMLSVLQQFGQLVGGAILAKSEGYIEQGNDYNDDSSISPEQAIVKAILNRGLIIGMCIYFMSVSKVQVDYFKNLFNLYCFGTILFFLFSPIHITFARVTAFYDIIQVIMIPQLFLMIRKPIIKYVLFTFLIVLMFVRLTLGMSQYDDRSSYKFIPSIEKIIN